MSEWHTGWTEGYASARSEAQVEIEKLRAENETHKEIAVRETMNVATLRAALKRLHDAGTSISADELPWSILDWWNKELAAARAAYKGEKND